MDLQEFIQDLVQRALFPACATPMFAPEPTNNRPTTAASPVPTLTSDAYHAPAAFIRLGESLNRSHSALSPRFHQWLAEFDRIQAQRQARQQAPQQLIVNPLEYGLRVFVQFNRDPIPAAWGGILSPRLYLNPDATILLETQHRGNEALFRSSHPEELLRVYALGTTLGLGDSSLQLNSAGRLRLEGELWSILNCLFGTPNVQMTQAGLRNLAAAWIHSHFIYPDGEANSWRDLAAIFETQGVAQELRPDSILNDLLNTPTAPPNPSASSAGGFNILSLFPSSQGALYLRTNDFYYAENLFLFDSDNPLNLHLNYSLEPRNIADTLNLWTDEPNVIHWSLARLANGMELAPGGFRISGDEDHLLVGINQIQLQVVENEGIKELRLTDGSPVQSGEEIPYPIPPGLHLERSESNPHQYRIRANLQLDLKLKNGVEFHGQVLLGATLEIGDGPPKMVPESIYLSFRNFRLNVPGPFPFLQMQEARLVFTDIHPEQILHRDHLGPGFALSIQSGQNHLNSFFPMLLEERQETLYHPHPYSNGSEVFEGGHSPIENYFYHHFTQDFARPVSTQTLFNPPEDTNISSWHLDPFYFRAIGTQTLFGNYDVPRSLNPLIAHLDAWIGRHPQPNLSLDFSTQSRACLREGDFDWTTRNVNFTPSGHHLEIQNGTAHAHLSAELLAAGIHQYGISAFLNGNFNAQMLSIYDWGRYAGFPLELMFGSSASLLAQTAIVRTRWNGTLRQNYSTASGSGNLCVQGQVSLPARSVHPSSQTILALGSQICMGVQNTLANIHIHLIAPLAGLNTLLAPPEPMPGYEGHEASPVLSPVSAPPRIFDANNIQFSWPLSIRIFQ
ncbi:MAG: hypothetical protein HQM15_11455 [Deltaproteobacteria bacterium]|nr:hypothetical protein [Deltaproteobacteria bacterium]